MLEREVEAGTIRVSFEFPLEMDLAICRRIVLALPRLLEQELDSPRAGHRVELAMGASRPGVAPKPGLRLFRVDQRFAAGVLGPADEPELQRLLEADPEFFQVSFGAGPGPGEAQRMFGALPPGTGLADKFTVGFRAVADGALVGAADMVRDYPDPGDWTLGMLFVARERRGAGLGAALLLGLETWLEAAGCRRVRLAVAEPNRAAARFWMAHGYERLEKVVPVNPSVRTQLIFVKRLGSRGRRA